MLWYLNEEVNDYRNSVWFKESCLMSLEDTADRPLKQMSDDLPIENTEDRSL